MKGPGVERLATLAHFSNPHIAFTASHANGTLSLFQPTAVSLASLISRWPPLLDPKRCSL